MLGPTFARAAEDICRQSAEVAARAQGVPLSVMMAITLTETGRSRNGDVRPWPWTVNMEGKGVWFDDPDSAKAYVYKHFKRGARSFDVGCFQINFKWHGQAFASIEDMFDPEQNADYAARFLKSLFSETGDWSAAAGAYHSRTPELAEKYRKRFDRFRLAMNSQPALPPKRQDTGREVARKTNSYPLLQANWRSIGRGSLFPSASGPRRPLFGNGS